ncbi:hypothetical protein KIF24_05120 [Micromonospora sp. Llam7]|uniref:hypothetical protein n=1 Tax=Micromonospora tarapacensis TaxID=2835305 RepID=UPI001C82EE33|nr:hypothetical protein [Micromonospora tarapacensis]MBX7265484.1 hypothetical protein [Micromonospora tarapacensis]
MRQEEQQLNNDHPEAVRSDPVEVPSNPEDRNVTEDVDAVDEPADRDRSEAADRARPWDGRPGGDPDQSDVNEPAPVPTAFGATTVGGAVAASALADPRPENEPDPREESTAQPGDGAVDGDRVGRRADPTAEFDRDDDDLADDLDDTDVASPAAVADRTDAHRAGDRRTDDDVDGQPGVTGAGPPSPETTPRADDVAAAGGAGYGSATPTMVDPDAEPRNDGTPEAAVPAGAATLFDDGTAQGFRDRWRDVQLRFVDDPRAAAGEAQSLVDEAMQALSAALAEHKDKLGGWQQASSTDTERLRMAVREYRDFLDRVLGR